MQLEKCIMLEQISMVNFNKSRGKLLFVWDAQFYLSTALIKVKYCRGRGKKTSQSNIFSTNHSVKLKFKLLNKAKSVP